MVSRGSRDIISFLYSLISAILILVFLASLPLGFIIYTRTSEGTEFMHNYVVKPTIWIFILLVELPIQLPVWVVWYFLQAVFIISFIASVLEHKGVWRALDPSIPIKESMRNFMFSMPFITTASLILVHILTWVLEYLGIRTGYSGELPEPAVSFFILNYAPVAEEIGFRLLSIGLPLAIILLLMIERWSVSPIDVLKALLCPGKLRQDLKARLKVLTWLLILISSIAFGLAHQMGGWEYGKAITSLVMGIILGLCYVYYGIHACLLTHWFFDYHLSVWTFMAYFTKDEGFASIGELVWTLEFCAGILLIIILVSRIISEKIDKNKKQGAVRKELLYLR